MKKSIRKQFTVTIVITGIILSLSGMFLVWKIFAVQKEQAIELQTEVGKRAINEFIILTHELTDRFLTLVKLYDLLSLPPNQQSTMLSKIRAHKDAMHEDIIDEIVLFNAQGGILSSASRINIFPTPEKYSWSEIKNRFRSHPNEETYFSVVSRDENGEPFIIFAVPLINFQTGEIRGILAARIRINLILDKIVRKPVGQRGILYITDRDGLIIAHPNPSVVLRGIVVGLAPHTYFQLNLNGEQTIRNVANVPIGNQDFFIVIERPVSEALALTIQAAFIVAGFLLMLLTAGIACGVFFTQKIIRPIESLASTAQKVRAGELSATSSVESDNELGFLARSFNAMTTQLSTEIVTLKKTEDSLLQSQTVLEQKVAEQTTELRKLLQFSQILTTTTDLKSLYRRCVELAKELLNLDFSTIMILSEDNQSLVIQDTIGFPESTIGTFSLVKGQGLSTYVVTEKKPADVVNFNTESRFEVPPLVFAKNITSSLCVPMMIGKDVFGVFIGHTLNERHFHKDEISLYQSFANQAAVAIKNAMHLKELHDSELKFKELFNNANDAILVYDLNGALLEVNKVTCERLGYTKDELLHFPPHAFIPPQFTATLNYRMQGMAENKKEIFETTHRKSSGEEIPVELSCTLIEYEGQLAVLGIARDISERKKMEEELLKNRRLESVGVLAGGIAHDFNNILAVIIGNLNLATARIDPKDSSHELLLLAEKAALRAKGLTQQLLTFSKGGEPVKQIASIAEVIKDSADFILRGKNIKADYSIPDNLWPVTVDTGQISQVIQNIVINACHVMPQGGVIEISCDNIRKEESGSLPVEKDDYVRISIQDHGPGIPPEQLSRIFDPYFTTKESGSGLGLAITHSIITKHGGAIVADSSEGHGAVFTIYLKASRHTQLEEKTIPAPSPAKGKGKLLVMDDDKMIRAVTYRLLSDLGYEVTLAAEGEEAVDLYRSSTSSEEFDAVIMDLTIPGGMGGKEAVQKILQINPQAKVIVSSGYSNDHVLANYRKYGFCAAIVKPYHLRDLMKVVEQVLA